MFYSSNPNMSHHLITYLRMQSCDLQLCFMLALFRDKKCCNCFNFVSCILWDFIVLGLVLGWWRIEHELKNKWISRKARGKLTREKVMSAWRILRVSRGLALLARHSRNWQPNTTLQFLACASHMALSRVGFLRDTCEIHLFIQYMLDSSPI